MQFLVGDLGRYNEASGMIPILAEYTWWDSGFGVTFSFLVFVILPLTLVYYLVKTIVKWRKK